MKMKALNKSQRKPWTTENNRELIELYNSMLALQDAGEKMNKAAMIRVLVANQERTKGSIECKLMNVSAIRQNLLKLPIVTGFKALDNYNHDLAVMVCNDCGFEYEK